MGSTDDDTLLTLSGNVGVVAVVKGRLPCCVIVCVTWCTLAMGQHTPSSSSKKAGTSGLHPGIVFTHIASETRRHLYC